MNRERNALRAGILIVTSTVLIIAVVLAIKGTARLFEPQQEIIVSFPLAADIGGLRVGDDLRLG
jgi:hypothetical protein